MEEPKGELRLRDPTYPPFSEFTEHRSVRSDAWTDDDRSGVGDTIERVFSQIDLGSECSELGSTSMSCGISAQIRDMDFPSFF
jgi:hypothetical protein